MTNRVISAMTLKLHHSNPAISFEAIKVIIKQIDNVESEDDKI